MVRWQIGDPGVFDDGYIHAKWREPAQEEFNRLLKEIYGENITSLYGFNFNSKYHKIDFNDVKDLSYEDVVKKYADKIYIDMKYYVFVEGEFNKREEAEKVYSLLKQHVLGREIVSFGLVVNYMASDFKKEFYDNFVDVRYGRNGYDDETLYNKGKFINTMGLVGVDLKDDYINDIINEFEY
ncbi:hypothetical protein [Acetivibrio clariflavus]|uniref:Uncharacterized protein n=1 Tax=Acetivibrio clariflavus (strain DSM 19732 / NBRC 101661 / EBR45) TaxID=720554 RepID=G8LTP9_ACECE|nr:hypothetical protein [Acetivibrio clariflavus]AEV70559.1 hypothetical protein Clocl_4128 [Acetivibrio clariflavus DSM 19732]